MFYSINSISLRPWQLEARNSLAKGFSEGHKNQILMCPTGGGKTILAMYMIAECLRKGKRAVFIADRRVLIYQTAAVASQVGLKDFSVFMASDLRYDPSKPFQIASAQTLARRQFPKADLYIVDEAHTMMKAWTNHINDSPGAFVGLSATPFGPLAKYFSNLVNAATLHSLTEEGFLVPMKVKACRRIDMTGAKKVAGEWSDKDVEERGKEIIGDVVDSWIKHAKGRKTIVFGSTIAHCESMCRSFNEAGVMARVYVSTTPDKDRADMVDEFKKIDSSIEILISVEALAKGFDNQLVSCVCDVRPLSKSLSTAIQMWGRMLRCHPESGKKDALLLDFSGNILRFAKEFEIIYYNGLSKLNDGEKYDKEQRDGKERESRSCPQCGSTPYINRCVCCGFKRVIEKNKVHHLGVMEELDIFGRGLTGKKKEEAIANTKSDLERGKIRATVYYDSIWVQCVAMCKQNGNRATAKGRASHLFKAIFSIFPPAGLTKFDSVDANAVKIDQEVRNRYQHNLIRFNRGQGNRR
ncbi:SSL2 DNA or RNA helicases of superfamily II [uncultured Caudovirales phage]|uniref:SSL2 DNA or RNA helicases of superfamily II n=1 Tax=uncultured Caudovirales phage TaxID=2100421 RepID=A0A6J5NAT5_9CAUD|nr:SSL2 DNA or RNA helicases of superfamily II [uncultured Caudovirales phage]